MEESRKVNESGIIHITDNTIQITDNRKDCKMLKKLSDNEIQILLSEKVLTFSDHSKQIIIRQIIFSLSENIDWQKVYSLILDYMPELNLNQ